MLFTVCSTTRVVLLLLTSFMNTSAEVANFNLIKKKVAPWVVRRLYGNVARIRLLWDHTYHLDHTSQHRKADRGYSGGFHIDPSQDMWYFLRGTQSRIPKIWAIHGFHAIYPSLPKLTKLHKSKYLHWLNQRRFLQAGKNDQWPL